MAIIRDVINALGQVTGSMSFPDGTSEAQIAECLAPYNPPTLPTEVIIAQKLARYQVAAKQLLIDLYTQNTMAGITQAQSDQMFDDYADVLDRLKEGAFPTALYRLDQKSPSGFVTQALLDSWRKKIQEAMV